MSTLDGLALQGACDGIWSFNGVTYAPGQDCVPTNATPPVQAAAPPAGTGAASSAIALPSGDRLRRQLHCHDRTGRHPRLNSDGQTDVIVTEVGTECYGATGQGFVLMTRAARGQWRNLFASPVIPSVLKTSGQGWPDIEIGLPGFCFPVLRWNGTTYAEYRRREEQRGACRQH